MKYTQTPAQLRSWLHGEKFSAKTDQAMLQKTIWCSIAVWDRCYSTFGEFIYGYWRRYYGSIIFPLPTITLSLLPSSILWHIWCVYQPPSIHPVSLYRHPSPLPAILSTLSTDLYCDYFLIHCKVYYYVNN